MNSAPEDAGEWQRRIHEMQAMRLLLGADGSVAVFSARASYPRKDDAVGVIDLGFIVRTTYQAIALAGHLDRARSRTRAYGRRESMCGT